MKVEQCENCEDYCNHKGFYDCCLYDGTIVDLTILDKCPKEKAVNNA